MGGRSLWRGGPKARQGFEGSSQEGEVCKSKSQEGRDTLCQFQRMGQSGCVCAAGFSQAEGVLLIPTHCEVSPHLAAFAREGDTGLLPAAQGRCRVMHNVIGVPGSEPVDCCIFKLPENVSDFPCEASELSRQQHLRLKAVKGGARSTHEALGQQQRRPVAPNLLPTLKAARPAEARRPDHRAKEKAALPPPCRRSRLQQHTQRRFTRLRKVPASTSTTTASTPPTSQQLPVAKAKARHKQQKFTGGLQSINREKPETCSSRSNSEPVHVLLRRLTELRLLQGLAPPLFCSCLSLPPPCSPSPIPQRGPASASPSARGNASPPPAPKAPVLRAPHRGTLSLGDGGRGPSSAAHAQRRLNAYLQVRAPPLAPAQLRVSRATAKEMCKQRFLSRVQEHHFDGCM
ncbi:hypothetical protein ACSSS7_002256 [Eimeria intestinalis]